MTEIKKWQTFLKLNVKKNTYLTNNYLTDLSFLGLLQISGYDAIKFLQGQLTCDLAEITPTESRLGAHCNPQGRVISLFRLFFYKENYYLQMPHSLLPIAIAALKKYAIFFKVALQDVSDQWVRIGYRGNDLIKGFPVPNHPDELIQFDDCIVIHLNGRYEILGPFEKISPLWKTLATHAQLSKKEWQRSDIQLGIPQIYPETSEKFLPHELNLPKLNAVSFKKGCFTGQEIIARMQYRGKLKKTLYSITLDAEVIPKRGHDIMLPNGNESTIVDFCKVSDNRYEMLLI